MLSHFCNAPVSRGREGRKFTRLVRYQQSFTSIDGFNQYRARQSTFRVSPRRPAEDQLPLRLAHQYCHLRCANLPLLARQRDLVRLKCRYTSQPSACLHGDFAAKLL
jgi:hypothetical protein